MTVTEAVEKWSADVKQYEQKKYNILAPRELGEVPPYHTPRLSVVEINADPQAGDVYALPGGGKLGLSKVALDRISQAAGISWDPALSGRVDDGRDPNIVRYRAVGRVKDLSGVWRTILGEKEVDLLAIEEELRDSIPRRGYIEKLQEPARSKAIEEIVTKEMIQFRKHKLARAQSGAMTRAIRSALALKSGYSKEELSRPFVLPKVVFTPDVSDPDVKRFLLAEATGNIAQLYGPQAVTTTVSAPMLPPAPEEDLDPEPTNGHGSVHAPAPVAPEPPAEPPLSEDAPDPEDVAFQEAYNAEASAETAVDKSEAIQTQVAILTRLIARKGFQGIKPSAKPIGEWERKYRLQLLQKLIDMPDVALEKAPF